jgi:hypothetical protein
MFRSPISRWIAGSVLVIAVLAFVRFKPWRLMSPGVTTSGRTGR